MNCCSSVLSQLSLKVSFAVEGSDLATFYFLRFYHHCCYLHVKDTISSGGKNQKRQQGRQEHKGCLHPQREIP